MKKSKTKGALYSLAKQAKMRMKNYSKEKNLFENIQYIDAYDEQDQILYRKICKMMEEDAIITNPIKELIDKKYYDSLSLESKQKYIFDLSDKYKEMKERYLKERAMMRNAI